MATPKGLVRYDNSRFLVFDITGQIPEENIINLFYSAKENKIWPLGAEGSIFSVNTTSFKVVRYNLSKQQTTPLLYGFAQKDSLNFISFNFSGKLYKNKWSQKPFNLDIYKQYIFENPFKIAIKDLSKFAKTDWKTEVLPLVYMDGLNFYPAKLRIGKYGSLIFDKQVLFQKNGQLYKLADLSNFAWDPGNFILDIETINNDLYLAIYGKGGGIFRIKDHLKSPGQFAPERISDKGSGTSVCKDLKGNLWYSIIGKGLFYIDHAMLDYSIIQPPLFDNSSATYTFIKSLNDSTAIVSEKENYFHLVNNITGSFTSKELSASRNTKADFFYAFPGANGPSSYYNYKDISHDQKVKFRVDRIETSIEDSNGLHAIEFGPYPFNIQEGDASGDKIIFSAGNQAIYCLNTKTKQLILLPHSKELNSINDIYFSKENELIFCTKRGVFITDASLHILKKISNVGYDKIIRHRSSFYLIKDKDLARYKPYGDSTLHSVLNIKYMIPRFSIVDIDASENALHLLTNAGYIVIADTLLPEIKKPAFTLESIQFGDSVYRNIINQVKVRYDGTKNLTFLLHFLYPDHANYLKQYSFVPTGKTEKWETFTGNSFIQNNNQPGLYTLKIRISLPEYRQSKTLTFYVDIVPTYWQSDWFKILIILFTGFSIVYVSWKLTRQNDQKRINELTLEQHISKIENKALLNQINPHFLFNALNTLQDYLIQKDTHNGIIYLQRLASLQRNILQFHQTPSIHVQEEKDFIEKYLYIQQKRYSDKFAYSVKADPNALTLKMPPMLLQPLVENAIEHAFDEDQTDGFISVAFSKKGNFLCIGIDDNGKGNAADILPFKKGHALYIVDERLSYFNRTDKKNKASFEIKNNTKKGIKIELLIPINQ